MKKYYFLIVGFLFFGIVNGQIVNIPDANFKAKLLSASPTVCIAKNSLNQCVAIDTNSDGNIQISEAAVIDYLSISNSNVSSFVGIQSFSNLTKFYCTSNQSLFSLNVSNMNSLVELYTFGSNYLSSINITGLNNLSVLGMSDCNINSINISSLTSLTIVNLDSNNISTLNVAPLTNLVELSVIANQLTTLDLSGLVQLNKIDCRNNNLTSLTLGTLPLVTDLNCGGNDLVTLNVMGLNALTDLNCGSNQLAQLNLANNPEIVDLFCNTNQLTTLDVNNLTKLAFFYCYDNLLVSLFFKNGKLISNFSIQNNPTLRYICTDESKVNQFQNLVNQYGYTNCQVNSYCSFVPGGNYNSIIGKIRFDYNVNNCDNNDIIVPNTKIKTVTGTTQQYGVTNNLGNYFQPVLNGTHVVSPILENPTYFIVSPASATISFPVTTSPAIRDFCLSVNGVHSDLEVKLLSINDARPGFDSNYKLLYRNKGTQTQSGTLNLAFNGSVIDFVSANPSTSNQTINNLSWSFANLQPFETREITIVLNLNSPVETPPLIGGAILNYTATITGASDETPLDNVAILNQTVVNSFDPNDKTCLEGATITPSQVGKEVHYMIRFENTGTANAQNIVVNDMIDATKFDVNSLIPISGSHPFITRITNTNKVEFIFENIQLPFDDANNDGYVAFKIKTKPTLVLGNTFSNTASIYFDYNFPIVTNTSTTTVSNVLANQDFIFANYISITPNPAKETLTINTQNIEVSSISIYNTLGQLVQVIPNAKEIKTIDVSELKSGNYFIKVVSDKGASSSKFIKE